AIESAFTTIKAPKGWNESTVVAQVLWMTETGATGNVVWKVGGAAHSSGSPINIDVSGSDQSVTSAAPGDGYNLTYTAETAAITLTDQSPGIMDGDLIILKVTRDATNGSDTLATDATLIGVALYYNTTKNTDD